MHKYKLMAVAKINSNLYIGNTGYTLGEIISSGSNSNGNWIKYGNGIMICWHQITGSQFSSRTSAGTGAYYYEDDNSATENLKEWIYPVEFVSTPVCSCTVRSRAYTMPSMGNITGSKAIGFCVTPYPVSSVTFYWEFIAIGKWK